MSLRLRNMGAAEYSVRDSKKCGDARPCERCKSRDEECISLEPTTTIVKKRCHSCRLNNRKVRPCSKLSFPQLESLVYPRQCEDRRPCSRCVEDGIECIDLARKGGPGSRIKRACTNCRSVRSILPPEEACQFIPKTQTII